MGNAGEDFGVRGWLAALDAATGRTFWKVFNTGPDSEVGIGPRFHPTHPQDAGSDLGVTSWPPSTHGNRAAVGSMAGRLRRCAPPAALRDRPAGAMEPDARQGDNRWTSGLFARDPDTGKALWFDAMNPHDQYALGAGGGLISARWTWQGGAVRC